MELFDIGINLTSAAFSRDRQQVVARAKAAGVTGMVLIGSNLSDSEQALRLAQEIPGCYSTAGIHPHYASEFDADSISRLIELIQNRQIRAIGETGLDFNRNYSSPSAQLEAFEQQLELACYTGLPVFLHQRDAHQQFLPLLKKYRDRLCDAVAHCFTGNQEELHDYLDLDLYIGITGWLCDERRGSHLQQLIKEIPANRLMLETDAPYLLPRNISPKPKNRRNEPAFISYLLAAVAACLNIPEHQLARQTFENAQRFFRLTT